MIKDALAKLDKCRKFIPRTATYVDLEPEDFISKGVLQEILVALGKDACPSGCDGLARSQERMSDIERRVRELEKFLKTIRPEFNEVVHDEGKTGSKHHITETIEKTICSNCGKDISMSYVHIPYADNLPSSLDGVSFKPFHEVKEERPLGYFSEHGVSIGKEDTIQISRSVAEKWVELMEDGTNSWSKEDNNLIHAIKTALKG